MRHRRAPSVEHGGDADPGAKMSGIGRDCHHRLRRRPEQQVVEERLVPPGDVGDLGWQREHDVEIADRQQVGLALGEPGSRGGGLTLRAVPIAATVVGDPKIATVVAAIDMAAECGGAAVLDRRHDLELGKVEGTGLNGAIAGPFSSEDIGDLKRGAQAGSVAMLLALHQRRQMFERTGHRADRLGRDASVERGRIELAVPQQDLDHADIDILFQQMGGKAVAQRMGRHPFPDASRFGRLVDRAVDLPS